MSDLLKLIESKQDALKAVLDNQVKIADQNARHVLQSMNKKLNNNEKKDKNNVLYMSIAAAVTIAAIAAYIYTNKGRKAATIKRKRRRN